MSFICTNKKIISDSNGYIKTNVTISDYLNVLNKLNILQMTQHILQILGLRLV